MCLCVCVCVCVCASFSEFHLALLLMYQMAATVIVPNITAPRRIPVPSPEA